MTLTISNVQDVFINISARTRRRHHLPGQRRQVEGVSVTWSTISPFLLIRDGHCSCLTSMRSDRDAHRTDPALRGDKKAPTADLEQRAGRGNARFEGEPGGAGAAGPSFSSAMRRRAGHRQPDARNAPGEAVGHHVPST